ncbi:hypothetical protein ACFFIX_14210 [Metabacillus herbersteinensis]|uniref:Transcriptional regulator n=1 Tax=Metabacillus herbersteinensis TaxID=283816 RepID=A0ABV6GGP5_9BACI
MTAVLDHKKSEKNKIQVNLTKNEKKKFKELQTLLDHARSVIELETYEHQIMQIIHKALGRQENKLQ